MKVCFVCPKAYPLLNPSVKEVFGGAELDLYLLGLELAKDSRFEVSFVVADYGQPEVETLQGVQVYRSVDFQKSAVFGARQIWRAMRRADAQIYMQETSGWGTYLVARFCRSYQKRFVYRTASDRECNGEYVRKHGLAGKAFVWALRHADHVIVQNQRNQECLKETVGVSSQVIRNAQYLPPSQPSTGETVLWVGRSVPVKRPDLFLALAEACPGLSFVMICQHATGDDRYDQLKARAEGLRNLTFLPRVAPQEIDGYYQRAGVLVNTSDSEGFPNTFIEACKWSVPILSRNVNPDGFLHAFDCGWCAELDWEAMIEKLQRLMQPSKQQAYGQRARAYVETHHDLRRVVEDYKQLFTTLYG